MGKERVKFKMSGYDLPIQDKNEREWYANVGRIQEQERIIKLLETKIEMRDLAVIFHKNSDPNEFKAIQNYYVSLIKGEK